MAARPTREVVPTSSAQIIAAGSQSSSPILPATSTNKVDVMAPGQSGKLYNMFDSDEDDPNPDTNGFVWNDENIFETGGLPQSSPEMFKRRSTIAPKRKTTQLVKSIEPGHEIFHNGEYYEFIGYAGDVELSDEELNSFEGEPGEYSNFLPLLGAFKIGKKLFKNRKKIGKGIKGIGKGLKGLKGIFRKRKKTKTARFDGLVEYEYFIGPDPVYSDLFGIKLKKIGKAIGKAVKNTGKALGKAGKFVGKNVVRAAKVVGKVAIAVAGGGQPVEEEMAPQMSQQQSYQQPEPISMPSGYMANNSNEDYDMQAPYINPDNGEMVIPNYNRNEAQDEFLPASNNNSKTILYVGIALVVVLIAYLLKNQK